MQKPQLNQKEPVYKGNIKKNQIEIFFKNQNKSIPIVQCTLLHCTGAKSWKHHSQAQPLHKNNPINSR